MCYTLGPLAVPPTFTVLDAHLDAKANLSGRPRVLDTTTLYVN